MLTWEAGGSMTILSPHEHTGWITVEIDGRWIQAKVYNEPSTFGINNGRISKLAISKPSGRDPNKPYFDQMDYNYDRGLDFDNLPDGVLDKVVAELEALPMLDV